MDKISSFLFNIDISSNAPFQGALLVAEPLLNDDYFNHAVICLTEYDDNKTTMGFILNNKTRHNLQSLIAEISCNTPIPVYCGGPMSEDKLFYIHSLGDIIPDSHEIIPGLYVGGDFNAVIKYLNSGYPIEGYIKFFIGYSGWDIGQLKSELRKNVWAVTTPTDISDLIKAHNDSYWHTIVRSMGNPYRGWLYHPKNANNN